MKGQLRTLTRAVFEGFFESELMAPGLPQVRLAILVFVVLMVPATHVPMHVWTEYAIVARRTPHLLDLAMWPHKLLFVTFAMMTTAVVALAIWDSVFPDRRDAFVIGHLPIRARTIVAARLFALTGLMALIALGSAGPSAIVYGDVAGGYAAPGVFRTTAAHFVATMSASAFVFLLLLSVQGLMLNVVPGRWVQRAMLLLQFVFIVASLEALLLMPPIMRAMERAFRAGDLLDSPWTAWAPPAWYLGLYEVVAGTTRPVGHLALRGVVALTALLPFAFGMYALTYTRLMRRAVESPDVERPPRSALGQWGVRRLVPLVARSPVADAVCRFSLVTLARSRKHRLLLTLFAGVGTTVAAAGVLIPITRGWTLTRAFAGDALLPFALSLVFFMVAGLRVLFSIPAEPGANWTFRLSDAEDTRLHGRGARAAMWLAGVFPVVLILLPFHVVLWGGTRALAHSVFVACAGALLVEAALFGFKKVPFTCPYSPPVGQLRLFWPLVIVAFTTFCYTLAAVEALALASLPAFAALVASVLAAWRATAWWRERRLIRTSALLVFEEPDGEQPITLALGGVFR